MQGIGSSKVLIAQQQGSIFFLRSSSGVYKKVRCRALACAGSPARHPSPGQRKRRGGCWSERRLVTAVCQVTAGHGRGFAAGRKRGAGFAQPAVERPGARVVVAS